MNKKTLMVGIASFALGGLLFVGFTGAKAYQGVQGTKASTLTQEQKTAADQAITNSDYQAWKTAMGTRPITQKVNEGNFAQYVQAQNLIKEGKEKMDEAQKILTSIGIDFKGGRGMMGGSKLTDAQRTAIDTAIASGDYQAWKTAIGNSPIAQKVTEANFAKYVEAEKLAKSGDIAGAKKIFDELGIKRGFGIGEGRRMMGRTNSGNGTSSQ